VLNNRTQAHGLLPTTSLDSMPLNRPLHNFHNLYSPLSHYNQLVLLLHFSPRATILYSRKSTRTIMFLLFRPLLKHHPRIFRASQPLSTGEPPLPIHGWLTKQRRVVEPFFGRSRTIDVNTVCGPAAPGDNFIFGSPLHPGRLTIHFPRLLHQRLAHRLRGSLHGNKSPGWMHMRL
jgi:hypothetical protein